MAEESATKRRKSFHESFTQDDFQAALDKDDREAIWSMVASNGFYLRQAPNDMRSDVDLQRAAVISNGNALEFADKIQSDYETVRSCVEKRGWIFQHASPELRSRRDLVMLAIATYGEALQYASEELQADQELALIAAREASGPLQPYHTSSVLLHNAKVVALLFPNATPVEDDWLVLELPGNAYTIDSTATHIPTKRWFIGGKDEMVPGLAPPPTISTTLETTLGSRSAQLTIKVGALSPDDDENCFNVSTNGYRRSHFSLAFLGVLGNGKMKIQGEKMCIPSFTVTLYYFEEDEPCNEEAYFDLTLEPSKLTMTLTSFRASEYEDQIATLWEEEGGFRLQEPLELQVPESLGRRLQSEAFFLHRWWAAKI